MAKEKIPEELGLALVLTVYEAKGLEFDDVLLYNFFTDSEVCHTDFFSHNARVCVSYPAILGKRIWSWVEESLPKVPISVLEYHPFSVGLGVFDVGFDSGSELFHSVLWAGSHPSLFSCLHLLLNAWYPSASCQFSLAPVILDSEGCSSWSEL